MGCHPSLRWARLGEEGGDEVVPFVDHCGFVFQEALADREEKIASLKQNPPASEGTPPSSNFIVSHTVIPSLSIFLLSYTPSSHIRTTSLTPLSFKMET